LADKVKGKKSQSTVDEVFAQHRFDVLRGRFLSNKVKVFVLGVVTGFVLISAGFILSSASKVNGIEIAGNYFLSEEKILELSGINEDSRYLFVFDSVAEDRLVSNPLIESAEVNVRKDGSVSIEVKEKVILGYRYKKYPELVFADGTLMELNNEYASLYAQVPLIVGFNEEMNDFAEAFENVPQKRIASISEIHRYEYTYDANGLEFVMKDGNRFFASFYSADVINQYNGVASALTEKNVCLYADENSGNVYKSLCPEEAEALALQEAEDAESDEKAEE